MKTCLKIIAKNIFLAVFMRIVSQKWSFYPWIRGVSAIDNRLKTPNTFLRHLLGFNEIQDSTELDTKQ